MIKSFLNVLRKLSHPIVILILLILFVISGILINGKPFGVEQLKSITNGVSIPDLEMFGYSSERLYGILDGQGDHGRAFYLNSIIPQDFPFPLFYGLFYASALIYLTRRLYPNKLKLQYIGFIGIFAGLFDWCENICLLIILLKFPKKLITLPYFASVFTLIKTILTIINILLLIIGFTLLIKSIISAKMKKVNR